MLSLVVYQKHLLFQAVLMDSWYATKTLMLHIEGLGKTYYCPLKTNRRVDDSNGADPFRRIDNLVWTQTELNAGKRIKIRGFPKNHKVKLFRVASSTGRTDYVVTNDLVQNDTSVVQQACNWRWKIEQFHREAKQLTGLETVSMSFGSNCSQSHRLYIVSLDSTPGYCVSDWSNDLSSQTRNVE